MSRDKPGHGDGPPSHHLATSLGTLALVASVILAAFFAPHHSLATTSFVASLLVLFFVVRADRRTMGGNEEVRREHYSSVPSVAAPALVAASHTLTDCLPRLGRHSDDVLREAVLLKLDSIQNEMRSLADGKVEFSATEGWRTVYERLLRCADIDTYRSVAWVRTEDYWRDAPGRRSMQLNFERLREGVRIERILILSDFYWPSAALLPSADISRWIEDQHEQGVQVSLVRESEIEAEADLLCDLGIYGNRATGWLELDAQCRTCRFTFDFSPESLRTADERWRRLSLYAISFAELLERTERTG